MKQKILIISPPEGIGGGNRKYKIFYDAFKKTNNNYYYYWKLSTTTNLKQNKISEQDLLKIIKDKNINLLYLGNKLSEPIKKKILKQIPIIHNTNFLSGFKKQKNEYNLIISKTLYTNIALTGEDMSDSFVVYNPINVTNWLHLQKKAKKLIKTKKIVLGALARSEPSKWDPNIFLTLLKLDKQKNYNYKFIFVGMHKLMRTYIKLFLSKRMEQSIKLLPEQKNLETIADFYNTIDIYWQSSPQGETFGNVICEAACFKKPTITNSVKAFNKSNKLIRRNCNAQIELVDHEKTGWYATSPEIIIKTLANLNKNKIETAGKCAFKKTKQQYDVNIGCETTNNIFSNLLTKTNINLKPSSKEINSYLKEYKKRLRLIKTIEKSRQPNTKRKILLKIDIIYLIIRKSLKIININLER